MSKRTRSLLPTAASLLGRAWIWHRKRVLFRARLLASVAAVVALCALAAAVVAWAWWPAHDAPYHYDDYVTPVKDPASQGLNAWLHAMPHTLRPLTKLTFAVESSVGATSAADRRVLQAGLGVACALLLGLLLVHGGAPVPMAVASATLWAVHPVHAQTVVALAGRSALLALCLTLASALLLNAKRFRAAAGVALLAVLARETALLWWVACAVVVARQHPRATRVRIGAYFAGAVVVGLLCTLASQRARELLAYGWHDALVFDRLGLQWAAIPRALWLYAAHPSAFAVDVDFAASGATRATFIVLGAAWVALLAWLAVRPGPVGVRTAALLWLCLMMPTQSIVPKLDALTARPVSTSSAALVLLCVLTALPWLNGARWRAAAATVLLTTAVLALAPLTRARARSYQDPVALWQDAADQSTTSTRPYKNLGTLLAQRGALVRARDAMLEAVRRAPHDSDAQQRLEAIEVLLKNQALLAPTDP